MATIIIGTYMVRYPLGGNLSWALQYLVGFKALGHDVYMVEKHAYANSCYDPVKKVQSDDCSYGIKTVAKLLQRFGLSKNWCFVDNEEVYHGMSQNEITDVFRRADLYIESGAHYSWQEESMFAASRVYIDVDPAYSHIRFQYAKDKKMQLPEFDHYFTNGMNVGKPGNMIPAAGINWQYIFNPVNVSLFQQTSAPEKGTYSTIMNWKSYEAVEYNGRLFGQKDIEFEKFISLPRSVNAAMEVAVSGINENKAEELRENGWSVTDAQQVTITFDTFRNYICNCRGEFSVCKNVYVATNSGWFSDKSAAFMASSRPVVVQETGFSDHLPVNEGLFAVKNIEEARLAIETIESNYEFHCKRAREIAWEYLDTGKVLKKFLEQLGV